jgi:hypothetical protein
MGMAGIQHKKQHRQQTVNGVGNPSSSKPLTQYANGDYRPLSDDNKGPPFSDADTSTSRPESQGLTSLSSQSRPNTSGEQVNSANTTGSPSKDIIPQQRPGSAGTDIGAPPAMRHGFAEAYSSEEYLTMLEQVPSRFESF